jgi:hypothetical protein
MAPPKKPIIQPGCFTMLLMYVGILLASMGLLLT